MTDHYMDCNVLSDPEIKASIIINQAFAYLHQALVKEPHLQVGVSFPQIGDDTVGLGKVLRLHGKPNDLDSLSSVIWSGAIRDYITREPVTAVPAHHQQLSVRRVQVKSSTARLVRRYMRRHGVDQNEAESHYKAVNAQQTTLPYLIVSSASTGQRFRIFIRQTLEETARMGEFNRYGFSFEATVPSF